eukprot:scaffold828_cov302-Pavlova_lutheri.AAC.5
MMPQCMMRSISTGSTIQTLGHHYFPKIGLEAKQQAPQGYPGQRRPGVPSEVVLSTGLARESATLCQLEYPGFDRAYPCDACQALQMTLFRRRSKKWT